MLLNFQKQFAPYILDGSKAHTIRGERKDGKRPKPGEMLHLYTGLRQPGAEFILRAPCLRTEDVEIHGGFIDLFVPPFVGEIKVSGSRLSEDEADTLAWRDGFRWRTDPCAHCCNWTHCNTLERCRQIGYPTAAGCFQRMMRFWDGRLPFHGWITYWDYSKAEFTR